MSRHDASTHDGRYRELLPGHALGILDADDERLLEEHLATCRQCREELEEWRRDVGEMAGRADPVAPSVAVRRRLMAAVEEEGEGSARDPAGPGVATGPGTGRLLLRWLPAAAILVLAVGAALWLSGERSRLRAELEQTWAEVETLEERLEGAHSDLRRTRAELASLTVYLEVLATAPPEGEVLLAGLDAAPRARGRLFVQPEDGRAVFVVGGLPELPSDRVYQLWSIVGETPRSAGTFRVGESGGAIVSVDRELPRGTDNWAVTVEPEGGVAQPTGEMVLLG